jgi:hypothetical protein
MGYFSRNQPYLDGFFRFGLGNKKEKGILRNWYNLLSVKKLGEEKWN